MFAPWIPVIFVFVFSETVTLPLNSQKLESMPEYMDLLASFKNLQSVKTKEELKSIVALGLVTGAIQVHKDMKDNLFGMVTDLLDSFNISEAMKAMPKVESIESTVRRDRAAILVLGKALELARGDASMDEYRSTVKKMMRSYNSDSKKKNLTKIKRNVSERLQDLKKSLVSHMDMMKDTLKENGRKTLVYLAQKHDVVLSQTSNITDTTTEQAAIDISPTLISVEEPIENNIIENVRRQDVNITDMSSTQSDDTNRNQEGKKDESNEFDDFPIEVNVDASTAPPGGLLTALLGSLSGGEGGSDVGALVGALTGVVMNLFGPGGLDIPSLLSAGSALLAGLLSGNRNFGTVLGEYVGLAVDGFSGGGGAINNGRFFGNLVGTVVAELSADPEDDDLPPKPFIFLQNFLRSFSGAKSKSADAESSDEDMASMNGSESSFGFITRIVKAIVGGITSFVLNASLGSSSGSSKGSSNH